jgi:peptidoglycan/xylan/chitin deacetylase (PgdA/CDA1 family)
MMRRFSLIVILALTVAFCIAGCDIETSEDVPTQSIHETDVIPSENKSTQPDPGNTPSPETAPGSGMPPAAPLSPWLPAPQVQAAPPSTEALPACPALSAQVSENRIIPSRVPILYYHSISDQPVGIRELSVSTGNFEAQIRYLAENGYIAISFAELDNFTQFEKPVIITLDDGYADNYQNAYPILKKYNLQATIFVISGLIGTPGYLTREEMAEMTDIISFQGHTTLHENLTRLSPERLEEELTAPQKTISDITNEPVYVFAYPTGYYNDAVKSAVSEHYEYAVTINRGYYEDGSDKLLILRQYVHRDRTLDEFISRLG